MFWFGCYGPFEDNKHFFDRIFSKDEFADVVGKFVQTSAVEELGITDLFEDAEELVDYCVFLGHVGKELLVF